MFKSNYLFDFLFILKHYLRQFRDQIGLAVPPIEIPYPIYKFQYVSAGGNSSQDMGYDMPTAAYGGQMGYGLDLGARRLWMNQNDDEESEVEEGSEEESINLNQFEQEYDMSYEGNDISNEELLTLDENPNQVNNMIQGIIGSDISKKYSQIIKNKWKLISKISINNRKINTVEKK